MTQILQGAKSYAVFYLIVVILIQLVPKKNYRKYISFFLGMLLVFSFLSPVLSILFDADEFLTSVEYEAVQEQLAQLQKDTDRIEFLQEDYYEKQSVKLVELELEQMALVYGLETVETETSLGGDGRIDGITMIVRKEREGIEIETVRIGEAEKKETEECSSLRQNICDYYQMEKEAVRIYCEECP